MNPDQTKVELAKLLDDFLKTKGRKETNMLEKVDHKMNNLRQENMVLSSSIGSLNEAVWSLSARLIEVELKSHTHNDKDNG